MATSFPDFWRLGPSIYRLEASKCKKCGAVMFPLRKICLSCGSTELEKVNIARRGKIVTYTISYIMPRGAEVPAIYAVVEMEDGAKLSGYLTECDPNEVKVDMPVEIVFRKISEEEGRVEYGYKFRPIR